MKPLIDGFSIDAEVANDAVCESCGAKMEFDPRPGEVGRYEAWAVCTNEDCENEYEF